MNAASLKFALGLDKRLREFGTGNRRFGAGARTGNGGYTMSEGAVGWPGAYPPGVCPPANCNPGQFTPLYNGPLRRKFLNMRETLAANETAVIIATPQEKIQISCLMVPSSIGTIFTVDDVSIGTYNQNVAPGTGALAQVFSEVAIPACGYLFDVICDIGLQVRLTVTNLTAEEQEFFATFIGCSVSSCNGPPAY
jgi:hypothetical protein